VGIPAASVSPCSPGCPTGVVANNTTDFGGGFFIFDTEDGILASWNGAGNAATVVDSSTMSAVYKGLALLNNASGNFLLAANFTAVRLRSTTTTLIPPPLSGGTFTDPGLPAGYAPHGVHVITTWFLLLCDAGWGENTIRSWAWD